VIHDLETAVGPHATYITDIGEHMLFALHYLTAVGPNSFAIHLALGSMASGICSAIGHAVGNRDRRVVCVCGDGGMQMAGSELLVALKLKLPIIYAVFNDARYNMVYHGYKQQFGKEATWDTPWVDFVAWAGAMGMPGARIDRPGQITADLINDLTSKGLPVVLDIRHDAGVRIRGAGRVEALQHMSAPPPPMRPSARPGSIPPPSARPPHSSRAPSARPPRSVPPPSSIPSPISVRVPQSTPPLGIRGLQLGKALIPPPPAMPSMDAILKPRGEPEGE
jgi:acetolactate synthase-1/2/3 large subunit